MRFDLLLNIRLAFALALVTVWAVARLSGTPILGDMMAPLFVAPLLLIGRAELRRPVEWRNRQTFYSLAALILVIAALFGLGRLIPEDVGRAFL